MSIPIKHIVYECQYIQAKSRLLVFSVRMLFSSRFRMKFTILIVTNILKKKYANPSAR